MSRAWPPGTKELHGPISAPESSIREGDLVRIHPESFVQPRILDAVGRVELIEETKSISGWVAEVLWTEEFDARRLLPERLGLDKLAKVHPLERLAHQSE